LGKSGLEQKKKKPRLPTPLGLGKRPKGKRAKDGRTGKPQKRTPAHIEEEKKPRRVRRRIGRRKLNESGEKKMQGSQRSRGKETNPPKDRLDLGEKVSAICG